MEENLIGCRCCDQQLDVGNVVQGCNDCKGTLVYCGKFALIHVIITRENDLCVEELLVGYDLKSIPLSLVMLSLLY